MRPFERVSGRYPSQDACSAALERAYAGLIRMLQSMPGPGKVEVQQEPGRWTWTTSLPGQRPQEARAWCAETP